MIAIQIKKKLRSLWKSKPMVKILLLIPFIVLFPVILSAGFFLDQILLTIFPGDDPFQKFSELLFYYFFIDFIMRFFMQRLPDFSFSHYLILSIKKSRIIHYFMGLSFLSLFNVIPFYFVIIFTFKYIIPVISLSGGVIWAVTIISLILLSHFLTIYLKIKSFINPFLALLILIIPGTCFYMEYNGILFLSKHLAFALNQIGAYPYLIFFPLLLLWLSYHLTFKLVKQSMYLNKESKTSNAVMFDYLTGKFGKTGELILLDFKMILRNNCPKKLMIFCSAFFLIGLTRYFTKTFDVNPYYLVFMGMLDTGWFMYMYGRWFLSWESSFFNFLLVKNIFNRHYFSSKYQLFLLFNTITFVLTLPFAFYNFDILPINLALFLYNSSINSIIILFLALNNRERIDLSGSIFSFGSEGISLTMVLVFILMEAIPLSIFFVFNFFGKPWEGIYFIGALGLLGFAFKNKLIQFLVDTFESKRYIAASSLRIK